MPLFFIYLIAVNIAAFMLFGADKRRAQRNEWRIRERTLFLAALLGGGLGALAGMYFFHHKTHKWYFVCAVPLIAAVQLIAAVYLLS